MQNFWLLILSNVGFLLCSYYIDVEEVKMAKTGMKSAFKMGEGTTASVILPTKFTTTNTVNANVFHERICN